VFLLLPSLPPTPPPRLPFHLPPSPPAAVGGGELSITPAWRLRAWARYRAAHASCGGRAATPMRYRPTCRRYGIMLFGRTCRWAVATPHLPASPRDRALPYWKEGVGHRCYDGYDLIAL